MRLSVQAAMVCRKHNDSSISSMEESCPRQWAACVSEGLLKLVFHLLLQHEGIPQRRNSPGHGNSGELLKERAFARKLPYRSRQKRITNLYGIQRTLPLLDSCCALYLGNNCVKDRDTLLNEPKELFECIQLAKLGQ